MELLALCAIMIVIIAYMFYLLYKKDDALSKMKQDLWSVTSQKNQLVEENTKLKQQRFMRHAEMIVDEAIPVAKDASSVIPEAKPKMNSNPESDLSAFCLSMASKYGSIATDPRYKNLR